MPETENTAPEPATVLVVTQAFQGHERGEEITDPEHVAEILAGEWAAHVVKRAG